MALLRSVELRWQLEVIERWLNSPLTPVDVRPGLLEMLATVKQELEILEAQLTRERAS